MELKKKKYLSTTLAMKLLKAKGFGQVTRATVISWIDKYKLGIKIGGSWRIDAVKFDVFLKKGTHE